MNFSKAFETLKSGIKIQRSGWTKDEWIGLRHKNNPKNMEPYLIKTDIDTYAAWVPTITDLFAEDWKELDK